MQDTAGPLPLELKPCIAELLRTCIHPPTLLLRVEHVFSNVKEGSRRNAAVSRIANLSRDEIVPLKAQLPGDDRDGEACSSRPLRLALSDGVLQIQAVLAKRLYTKELLELQKDDLVEVRDFQLGRAPRLNGNGQVVYLGVQHCAWVGRDQPRERQVESEGGFIREDNEMAGKQHERIGNTVSCMKSSSSDLKCSGKRRLDDGDGGQPVPKKTQLAKQLSSGRNVPSEQHPGSYREEAEEEDDGFDTIAVPQSQMDQRREVLGQIEQNIPSRAANRLKVEPDIETESEQLSSAASPTVEEGIEGSQANGTGDVSHDNQWTSHQNGTQSTSTTHPQPQPQPQPQPHPHPHPHPQASSTLICPAAPLHTLASLYDPSSSLPQRNYACTIFGIITWVSASLIYKSHTPFPPKRHVKVHDPSISHRHAGVTLAVFVDAQHFMPKIGTVALFRGVVMQRCQNDVILNKYSYASSGKRQNENFNLLGVGNQDWCVTDEESLERAGFDVQGMKGWWEGRAIKKG